MRLSHLDLAVSVASLLDDLGVPYVVGGSVASSLVGEPRRSRRLNQQAGLCGSACFCGGLTLGKTKNGVTQMRRIQHTGVEDDRVEQ